MTFCLLLFTSKLGCNSNSDLAAFLCTFIKFDKAPTKFNEALTKPYHGLIEILQKIDFRYHSRLHN